MLISSQNQYLRKTCIFHLDYHLFVGVTALGIQTQGRMELKKTVFLQIMYVFCSPPG